MGFLLSFIIYTIGKTLIATTIIVGQRPKYSCKRILRLPICSYANYKTGVYVIKLVAFYQKMYQYAVNIKGSDLYLCNKNKSSSPFLIKKGLPLFALCPLLPTTIGTISIAISHQDLEEALRRRWKL